MNYGQKFGSLIKIKVDNMRVQHETILEHDQPSAAVNVRVHLMQSLLSQPVMD